MPQYVVTFDIDPSQDPDYRRVDEALKAISLRSSVKASNGNRFKLPRNTYQGTVSVDATTIHEQVEDVLHDIGYQVNRVFVGEYKAASFSGPIT